MGRQVEDAGAASAAAPRLVGDQSWCLEARTLSTVGDDPALCVAVIGLLAAADQACDGAGVPPDTR